MRVAQVAAWSRVSSSTTVVLAIRSCNACFRSLNSTHRNPAPHVAKLRRYPNVRRPACRTVIARPVSASTIRSRNARLPGDVPHTAHITPVNRMGRHCPIASQNTMLPAYDSGAARMSSVEGPSGTNSTTAVHQIESIVSAAARREYEAYRIGRRCGGELGLDMRRLSRLSRLFASMPECAIPPPPDPWLMRGRAIEWASGWLVVE